MKGGMQDMLRQVQKLQQDMQKAQGELANKTVTADAGGGIIKAVASGNKKIVSIEIDKQVINPEEKEFLEDLVVAAVNKALEAAEKMSEDEMGKLTKGMLPPGFNIPGF